MNEFTIYQIAQAAAGIGFPALGIWLAARRERDRERLEPLPRNRTAGAVLGLLALIWCIPHARPVVFDFMLPLLWPAAIAGAVLGYFFLDYLLSRAVGGLFILIAYYFVHSAFDWHTRWGAAAAVLYWCLGALGIAFSGKPCWMRDLLRAVAGSPKWRWGTAGFFILLGVVTLVGLAGGKGA